MILNRAYYGRYPVAAAYYGRHPILLWVVEPVEGSAQTRLILTGDACPVGNRTNAAPLAARFLLRQAADGEMLEPVCRRTVSAICLPADIVGASSAAVWGAAGSALLSSAADGFAMDAEMRDPDGDVSPHQTAEGEASHTLGAVPGGDGSAYSKADGSAPMALGAVLGGGTSPRHTVRAGQAEGVGRADAEGLPIAQAAQAASVSDRGAETRSYASFRQRVAPGQAEVSDGIAEPRISTGSSVILGQTAPIPVDVSGRIAGGGSLRMSETETRLCSMAAGIRGAADADGGRSVPSPSQTAAGIAAEDRTLGAASTAADSAAYSAGSIGCLADGEAEDVAHEVPEPSGWDGNGPLTLTLGGAGPVFLVVDGVGYPVVNLSVSANAEDGCVLRVI